ncbi:MAG: hypothetical protein SPE74_08565 [Oscillospiraceae bacterium]|nr:hypothetical protein [Oscillospiraceae bacterium]
MGRKKRSAGRVGAWLRRCRTDAAFRTELSLYAGMAFTGVYALCLCLCSWREQSLWTGTLAFYHLSLSGMRCSLVHGLRSDRGVSRWRAYRRCGGMLLLLTVAVSAIGVLTISGSHVTHYPFSLICGVAAYTLYRIVSAVRNALLSKTRREPVYAAGSSLSLAAALVSLYQLLSAIVARYGDEGGFARVMGIALGACITALIAGMAVHMIRRSTAKLRAYQ